jgi:F0F1-type ATP synthase membrane subunit c/vacuolar-type H+-ATPase subunit K
MLRGVCPNGLITVSLACRLQRVCQQKDMQTPMMITAMIAGFFILGLFFAMIAHPPKAE